MDDANALLKQYIGILYLNVTGFLCILAYNIQDAEQTQIERLFGIALLCVILTHFGLMSVAAVVVNNKVSIDMMQPIMIMFRVQIPLFSLLL